MSRPQTCTDEQPYRRPRKRLNYKQRMPDSAVGRMGDIPEFALQPILAGVHLRRAIFLREVNRGWNAAAINLIRRETIVVRSWGETYGPFRGLEFYSSGPTGAGSVLAQRLAAYGGPEVKLNLSLTPCTFSDAAAWLDSFAGARLVTVSLDGFTLQQGELVEMRPLMQCINGHLATVIEKVTWTSFDDHLTPAGHCFPALADMVAFCTLLRGLRCLELDLSASSLRDTENYAECLCLSALGTLSNLVELNFGRGLQGFGLDQGGRSYISYVTSAMMLADLKQLRVLLLGSDGFIFTSRRVIVDFEHMMRRLPRVEHLEKLGFGEGFELEFSSELMVKALQNVRRLCLDLAFDDEVEAREVLEIVVKSMRCLSRLDCLELDFLMTQVDTSSLISGLRSFKSTGLKTLKFSGMSNKELEYLKLALSEDMSHIVIELGIICLPNLIQEKRNRIPEIAVEPPIIEDIE